MSTSKFEDGDEDGVGDGDGVGDEDGVEVDEGSASATAAPATSTVVYGVNRNGLTQLRREWPIADATAVVLIVHGLAEHSGRYEHVGQFLNDHGYGAVAYDQRGHGHTGGRRAYIASFDEYLDDIEDHLEQLRTAGRPVVLCGHSMGGLAAAAYAVSGRPAPERLILSAPALGASLPTPMLAVPRLLSPVLGRTLLPAMFDSTVLSRDPAVGAAYDADPLIDPRSTVALVAAVFETMEATVGRLDQLSVPTLVMHGSADELVPVGATEPLEGLPGVERIVYPDMLHEIFNEIGWRDVLGDLVSWLDAQDL